jgi:hypothetical protein
VLAADGSPFDIQWQGATFLVPASPSQTGYVLADPVISVG